MLYFRIMCHIYVGSIHTSFLSTCQNVTYMWLFTRVGDIRNLSKHLQSVRVHNGKSPKSGAFGERFDEKRGSRFELDLGVLELRKLRRIFDLGTSGLLSHLPIDLGHLASNLGGTGEDNRAVSRLEDTRVLLNGDQSFEALDRL